MIKRFGTILLMLPLLVSLNAIAGEIRGIVRDSKTNEPVAGAIVFARSVANPAGINVLTEDDGRYVFLNLPAGTYTVTANFAGAVAESTVVLTDESSVSEASLNVVMSEAKAESYEVTGTRIRSPNQISVSPVTSVGEKDIKEQGSTSIETVINKLPQTYAAQGSTISNASDGTSNVNLRGLGASRSLVLIDGRRLGPGNPNPSVSAVPDLNFIPAALVERIDILTGGASAVYGADAVGGVTNFIMKKNFEGVQLDVSWGGYQHTQQNKSIQDLLTTTQAAVADKAGYAVPGNAWNLMGPGLSLTIGANSPDGKGNVTAFASYRRDNGILQKDRDFSTCALNSSNDKFSCGGSGNQSPAEVYFIREDGETDGDRVVKGHGFVDWNENYVYNYNPLNYFLRPDERYNLGAFAHYEIKPWVKPYAQVMFMDDRSVAQIAPSGTFFTEVPMSCDNPFLSEEQRNDICPPGSGFTTFTSYIGKRNVEGGPRTFDHHHSSYRVLTGLMGDFAKYWNYDAYLQYMSTSFLDTAENDFVTFNIARALNAVPDTRPGAAPGAITCASVLDGTDPNCFPYNVWDESVKPSAESLKYLQAPAFTGGTATQRVLDLNVAGDLGGYGVRIPLAREGLKVSVGTEWRYESIKTFSDYLASNAFLAGGGGKILNVDNNFSVYEVFSEARLPIIQDKPAAQNLTAEFAYRYSNYTFGKDTHTFKAGGDWEFLKDIRFRGSYQRASRAPSISELYQPIAVALDGAQDPCAGLDAVEDAAQVQKCMAAFGLSEEQVLAIRNNTANQYNGNLGGNANLEPEIANTFSVGFAAQPSFIKGLELSIDYFNISVDKYIGIRGADLILQKCVDGDAFYCSLVHRDAAAGNSLWLTPRGYVDDLTQNLGFLKTSGIDFFLDYRFAFDDVGVNLGALTLSFNGTWVHALRTKTLPDKEDVYDCTGLYGSRCGPPSPVWRHKIALSWETPINLTVTAQSRFLTGVDLDVASAQPAIAAPNAVFATDRNLPSRTYLDLYASYVLLDTVTFRAGINNVIDTDPPVMGGDSCGAAGQCNGNTFPQVYDTLGRQFFLSGTAKF